MSPVVQRIAIAILCSPCSNSCWIPTKVLLAHEGRPKGELRDRVVPPAWLWEFNSDDWGNWRIFSDEFHIFHYISIWIPQIQSEVPRHPWLSWLTSRLTPSLVHQGSQSRPTWDILFIWLCFVVFLLSTLYSVDILFDAAWFCEMFDAQTTHLPRSGWHHTCLLPTRLMCDPCVTARWFASPCSQSWMSPTQKRS